MVAEQGLQTVNAGIGMRAGMEIRGYADVGTDTRRGLARSRP